MMTGTVPSRAAVDRLERLAAHPATPWLVLALALALRLRGIDKGIWLDEAYALRFSVGGFPGDVLERLEGDNQTPLFYLLLHGVARIDAGVAFLRLLPVACGVATVAVVERWARAAAGPLAGALGGFLAATLPILLRTGDELRHNGLFTLLAAAALAAAARAGRTPGAGPYLALAASLAAAVSTHHLAALLVPGAVALALGREPPRPRPLPFAAALALPLALLALTAPLRSAVARDPGGWWMPELSLAGARAVLGSVTASASPSWREIVEPGVAGRTLGAVAALLAAAALVAGGRRALPPAAAAAAYLGSLALASLAVLPVFWTRTILPAVPPLLVAVAVGCAGARSARLRGALAAGLVAISAGFAIRWLGAEGGRALEPWEAAAAAIAAESGARDTLVLYPGYAGHALLHHLGPGRPPQVLWASLRDESAAAAVAERLARGRGSGPATIWLVLRADLTSGVDERLLPRLAAAVARERGLRPVRALIVPSPDAALDARVVALRSRMAERLAAELGPPAPGAPPGDDRLLDLRFAPADGPELR